MRSMNQVHIIEYFENIQPFESVKDIPDIPITSLEDYKNIIIPNLIRCGAIQKSQLIPNKVYEGSCRNAERALWDGEKFWYERYKWGKTYDESINHFEDDDGYDVFVPVRVCE